MLVVIAGAILQHGLTRSPVMWAIAYGAIGIAGILVPVSFRVPSLRLIAAVLLVVGAAICAVGIGGTAREHPRPDDCGFSWPRPDAILP
jgi:putative membrane protein